jgi:hypothetical protein
MSSKMPHTEASPAYSKLLARHQIICSRSKVLKKWQAWPKKRNSPTLKAVRCVDRVSIAVSADAESGQMLIGGFDCHIAPVMLEK